MSTILRFRQWGRGWWVEGDRQGEKEKNTAFGSGGGITPEAEGFSRE
jgi:hypothetical protein